MSARRRKEPSAEDLWIIMIRWTQRCEELAQQMREITPEDMAYVDSTPAISAQFRAEPPGVHRDCKKLL